ncbi:S26 family signal peptidase [Microbispora camponoti]|uniref:S26 family signal peptidase n=2 Tax=Microbispora bryophytorum TaxID=1460882 RepID=A0ABR8L2L4_9ACTN|nr:S26 family signal peptidase [Microbispora camponoti]
MAVLALATVTLGMRRAFVVVTVRGRSMQPTLRDGYRVLVRRRGVTAVRPDDLVVFADVIDAPPVPAPTGAAEDDGLRTVWVVKRDSRLYGYVAAERLLGVVIRRM